MYGLPETFDPSFLKGKDVANVCFGAYTVDVCLEEHVSVQIFGRYRFLRGDEVIEEVTLPVTSSSLVQLSGKRIIDVSFSPESGDIELRFEDRMTLFIQGDIGPYESYHLYDGPNRTIV